MSGATLPQNAVQYMKIAFEAFGLDNESCKYIEVWGLLADLDSDKWKDKNQIERLDAISNLATCLVITRSNRE